MSGHTSRGSSVSGRQLMAIVYDWPWGWSTCQALQLGPLDVKHDTRVDPFNVFLSFRLVRSFR